MSADVRRHELSLLAPTQLVLAAVPSQARAETPAQRPDSLLPDEHARTADANGADALALLERIVNLSRVTMNFAGVRDVGVILRKEFDALADRALGHRL